MTDGSECNLQMSRLFVLRKNNSLIENVTLQSILYRIILRLQFLYMYKASKYEMINGNRN